MNRVILTTIFLFAAARLSLAGTDPAVQPLLVAAEQQVDLFNHDASPFQLEVDFIAQIQVPTQGHLTYRWEAKDRWWRKVSMGAFEQIDVKNGEKLYTSRNTPFTPVRVRQLLNVVTDLREPG